MQFKLVDKVAPADATGSMPFAVIKIIILFWIVWLKLAAPICMKYYLANYLCNL